MNLVRRLFTTEERKISNVKGVMGKRKLDPDVMQQIKGATFQLFPCDTMENEGHVWTYCCKTINEYCCRLNRVMLHRLTATSTRLANKLHTHSPTASYYITMIDIQKHHIPMYNKK